MSAHSQPDHALTAKPVHKPHAFEQPHLTAAVSSGQQLLLYIATLKKMCITPVDCSEQVSQARQGLCHTHPPFADVIIVITIIIPITLSSSISLSSSIFVDITIAVANVVIVVYFTPLAQVGADLCMGSLIKNPGGTIVTGGGYVAGKAHLVNAAQARLTAPGVGMDAGCVPGDTVRLMMQGMLCNTMVHMLDMCV